ncbi:hypothetical protein DSM104299_00810 [Baekduia alba]|uniref:hypothetical protein n=1 Tax=Baekduia alba TaxID=2997333 RepID=UPI0023408A70|nr:hypothetical protein [Baekduia alba]WCB92125.1 hypothetical protein DSM104299_00810 [Baekduia alba]
MSDFARLAGQQCPPQEALAMELAVELGAGGGVDAARRSLAVLARALPDVSEPLAQLEALRVLAVRALRPRRDGRYLLPEILREGKGHPVGVAVALGALGQRVGWQTALVGHDMKLYLGHRELAPVAVVDPGQPDALVDPRTLDVDLAWRCAHEATGVVLRHVTVAAERSGDLTRSLGASALLLALPVDEGSRAGQTAMHQRLLSRLN